MNEMVAVKFFFYGISNVYNALYDLFMQLIKPKYIATSFMFYMCT